MNRVLFSIALVLALCIPTWAAYASPHTPAHEAPGTTEWAFYDETTTASRHAIVVDDRRLIPYAVGVACNEPVRVELVVPDNDREDKYDGTPYEHVWLAAYIDAERENNTDTIYTAFFHKGHSFGGFDYDDVYVRLRDPNDETQPFTGSVCTAAWFYRLPVEEASSETFENSGCLSAWSDYCV